MKDRLTEEDRNRRWHLVLTDLFPSKPWAKQKPGAIYSIQISPVGGRNPCGWNVICCLSQEARTEVDMGLNCRHSNAGYKAAKWVLICRTPSQIVLKSSSRVICKCKNQYRDSPCALHYLSPKLHFTEHHQNLHWSNSTNYISFLF